MIYGGFEIQSFEAGRGLWHARIQRADQAPVVIDGMAFPTLEVGFAWSDPEAAIAALEALKKPCVVDLTTDSQYVRQGITGWIHGWKKNGWRTADKKPVKNVDLWQRLETALGEHRINWHWVKGHAGHVMNERADQLARDGLVAARAGAIGAMKQK